MRRTASTRPVVTSRKLARPRKKKKASLGARTGLPRFVEDWLIAGQADTARGRIASQAVLHGIAVLVRKHPRAAASLVAAVAAHMARGTAFKARQGIAGWLASAPPADEDYLDLKAERDGD